MDSVNLPLRRAAGLMALAAGLSPVAFAQQGGIPAAPQTAQPAAQAGPVQTAEGVTTFEASYFRQYNPVTANDIVSRVPGFDIRDGDTLRGFGATAGNVLINGERPSSKTLISEQLKRIPADAVAKVELISGSSSKVDVRGQTQLVNVVLKTAKAGTTAPGTWLAEIRDVQYSERVSWNLQVTKSFKLGEDVDLTVDLQAPNLRGRTDSFEAVRNAAGVLTQYREQFGQPNYIGVQGTANLKWRPSAIDTVSFNAQYVPTWNTLNIDSIAFTPAGNFAQGTFGFSDYKNNYTGELAADWEHRFAPDLSLKVLGLATFNNVDEDDIYGIYTPTGTAGPGGLFNTQTFNRTTEGGERVARGVLTWRPNEAHTVDIGSEGAFNFRDTTLKGFNNFGAGPVAMSIPVADARVEEVRGEAFITDVWKISPVFTLETGFNFEASKITQTGDEHKEREFSYPKPRIIGTWQMGPTDQLRGSLIRDVAQLDFVQFATSINVVDQSQLIGNPNLEPAKTWKLRGEWEHKLGKRGAVTLAVFRDEVEDVQDFIPRTICTAPNIPLTSCPIASQRTFDAPGNIGDGTRTGVEARAAIPLAPLIPNAEVRFSGLWQKTEVTDPVTGEQRRFSGEKEWNYNASFRQDFPEWKAAWGASTLLVSNRHEFKVAEDILYNRPENRLDLYAETTQIKGVTIRFSASNIFHPEEERVRTFYQPDALDPIAPPRSTGILLRTETRKQKGGPDGTQVFSLRVSGSF